MHFILFLISSSIDFLSCPTVLVDGQNITSQDIRVWSWPAHFPCEPPCTKFIADRVVEFQGPERRVQSGKYNYSSVICGMRDMLRISSNISKSRAKYRVRSPVGRKRHCIIHKYIVFKLQFKKHPTRPLEPVCRGLADIIISLVSRNHTTNK